MKEKVTSKILSVAWSTDGSMLAVGMQSGLISIRNQQAEETQRIERRAPVWALAFIPTTVQAGKGSQIQPGQTASGEGDTLVVGCWDKTLSFYRYPPPAYVLLVSPRPHMCCLFSMPLASLFVALTGCNKTLILCHVIRIQGTSNRMQSEKQLKYYPCAITLAGSQGNKSNYMVTYHKSSLHTQHLPPFAPSLNTQLSSSFSVVSFCFSMIVWFSVLDRRL